ncbi:MAG: M20/M25/M40 family metallo-hydrolase, partial [Gemmatimonadetes bacterium]|nr:M20/M25/M40 family metallo-hydrolase [Gemmatimonadota bacterium]
QGADWVIGKLREWGLSNPRKEVWGQFGRGWTNAHFEAHMLAPPYTPLIAYAKAWTPGTGGEVNGDAVIALIATEADFAQFRGKLRGKFVLTQAPPVIEPIRPPEARRLTDAALAELAMAPAPSPRRGGPPAGAMGGNRAFQQQLMQFLLQEGVAVVLTPGVGSLGTVNVSGGGSQAPDAPATLPQVAVAAEHYGRIWRILEKGVPVQLAFDIANTFHDRTLDSYNVLAEIPGTDPALKDQVVIIGGHFDTWHTGTGATDDNSGVAIMMEAMRILKAGGFPLKRTVRIALWAAEEQGLLGSRGYVKNHLADPATMELEPEHAKVSAYFNVDNGGGAIRGIYLQENEAIRPVYQAWMEPFRDLGMTTLTIRNTSGTDHLGFDAVGVPGFQFIQDPLDYGTRTHHTNMDLYERIVPADMMKRAVIVASFVYHAANRAEMLPREPLPAPTPPARR